MTNSGIDQSIILFLFEDNFCHGEKKYFKVFPSVDKRFNDIFIYKYVQYIWILFKVSFAAVGLL